MFTKGTPKPPGSGRKKGQSLRASARSICDRLGCDPIEGMIRLAEDPKQKAELRGRLYAELAQYIHPKLRSVEHSGVDGGPIEGRTVLEVIYTDKTIPE